MALLPCSSIEPRRKLDSAIIAIDDREGAKWRLAGKVADVEKALGRKVERE